MIIPAGKRRHQVNQGGTKNETIFDSDLFKNLTKTALNKEALAPMTTEQKPDVDPDLQDAMNSGGLDPGRNRAMPEMADKGYSPEAQVSNGQKARFDPYTGEPLLGVNGTKLIQMLEQWLGSNQETADLSIAGFTEKGGSYTVTFAPKGKMVTKGGI